MYVLFRLSFLIPWKKQKGIFDRFYSKGKQTCCLCQREPGTFQQVCLGWLSWGLLVFQQVCLGWLSWGLLVFQQVCLGWLSWGFSMDVLFRLSFLIPKKKQKCIFDRFYSKDKQTCWIMSKRTWKFPTGLFRVVSLGVLYECFISVVFSDSKEKTKRHLWHILFQGINNLLNYVKENLGFPTGLFIRVL